MAKEEQLSIDPGTPRRFKLIDLALAVKRVEELKGRLRSFSPQQRSEVISHKDFDTVCDIAGELEKQFKVDGEGVFRHWSDSRTWKLLLQVSLVIVSTLES